MRGRYKKFTCTGPGGLGCSCCTPAPPGKKMKRFFRLWKRREREEAKQEIQGELKE